MCALVERSSTYSGHCAHPDMDQSGWSSWPYPPARTLSCDENAAGISLGSATQGENRAETAELLSSLRRNCCQGPVELVRFEAERPGLALESDATVRVDQIHAIRPSGVGDLGGVAEFVEHCGKLYAQLTYTGPGDERAVFFILWTGKNHLVFDVALHLPDIAGVRLGDVHHQKGYSILVLVVELIESGNLPPEGWSRVTAKNEDYRLLGGQSRKLHAPGSIQFH
jgi:hypothetical protein